MQTYYWRVAGDDDFSNANAWTPSGGPPSMYDAAYVTLAGTYTVSAGAGASAGSLDIANPDVTLAVNGAELYFDDGLTTAGAITVDNGPYKGGNVTANDLAAGSLSVDVADGSGGGLVYVVNAMSVQGPVTVGNLHLSASTTVYATYMDDMTDISVIGPTQPGATASAGVVFFMNHSKSALEHKLSVTGNAELVTGFDWALGIGPRGVLSLDGSKARIDVGAVGAALASNQGTIALDDSANLVLVGDFVNSGMLSVQNGALALFSESQSGNVDNAGTISMTSSLSESYTQLMIFNGLTNSGHIDVANEGTNLGAVIDVTGDFVNSGDVSIADKGAGDGSFVRTNGALVNTGAFAVDVNGAGAAATTIDANSLQNTGAFRIGGGASRDWLNVATTATDSGGFMQIAAGATLSAPFLTVTNGGVLAVEGGAVDAGVTVQDGGVALIAASGFASGVTILKSGGTEIVYSGYSVRGPAISGGSLYLEQGAELTSPVSFDAAGGTVALFRSSLPTLQVNGLTPNARIDLFDVRVDPAATSLELINNAQQHNVLQFTDANGGLVDLKLDPYTDFTGVRFIAQSFLGKGVQITEAG